MKRTGQLLGLLAAVSVLLTACSGNSDRPVAEDSSAEQENAGDGILVEESGEEEDITVEEAGDGIVVEEPEDGILVEESGDGKQGAAPAGEDGTEEAPGSDETSMEIPVDLSCSYTTRFEAANMITYPDFLFCYPNSWSVKEEDATAQGETVVLTNERGVTVTFSHICGVPEGQLSASTGPELFRAELSEASESAFVPGYVQATDHSDLGRFVVAKVQYTGRMVETADTDFEEIDGETLYAVLPESRLGTDDRVCAAPERQFAFWYSDYISMLAQSPDGTFTPQEEREVIAILETFRTE